MADQTMTADQVHNQVHAMRAQTATVPQKVELGRQQMAAIEAAQREAAGSEDVGPIREFQGMAVVKSRRENHVLLLAEGDSGEDVELEPVTPEAPSGPDAPAVEEAQPTGA
jgi:hypothetical protein